MRHCMARDGLKGARPWGSFIADEYGLACGIEAGDDSSDFHNIPLGSVGGHNVARRCDERVSLMSGANDVVTEATVAIFDTGNRVVHLFQAEGGVLEE